MAVKSKVLAPEPVHYSAEFMPVRQYLGMLPFTTTFIVPAPSTTVPPHLNELFTAIPSAGLLIPICGRMVRG
jgi:hypothetical protein